MLRNDYIDMYRASGAPVFPAVVQQMASRDIVEAAAQAGNGAFYPMYAGQGVGLIDAVPAAAEIVRAIVEEARQASPPFRRSHLDPLGSSHVSWR